MYNLKKVIDAVSSDSKNLDKNRRRSIILQLQGMRNDDLCINPSELPRLLDSFRVYLKSLGSMSSSTVYQQVYRLKTLLTLAEEQGLINGFTNDFPLFSRPASPPDQRRWSAYNSFCDWSFKHGTSYQETSTQTFIEYRTWLKKSGAKSAETRYLDLCRYWRERGRQGALCPIEIPPFVEDRRSQYGLGRSSWPSEVEEQFAAFERGATGHASRDEKRWKKPLSKASLVAYEKEIRQLLGFAMNIRDKKIDELSLDQILADDSLIVDFVNWHIKNRANGREREYHVESLTRYAKLLEWLDPSAEEPSAYIMMAISLNPEAAWDKFPEKPINHDEFIQAAFQSLVDAKHRWESEKRLGKSKRKYAAIAYRDALLFSFLIMRPIREKNILTMELGRHLREPSTGKWEMFFTHRETKGGVDFHSPFPETIMSHLIFYIQEIHPELEGDSGTNVLFLSKSGRRLLPGDIWRRLTKIGNRYLGIKTNPHIFRALIPSAYLLDHPHKLQEVQALLGHASIQTTLKYYVIVYSQIASRKAAKFARSECPHLAKLVALTP